LSLYQRAELWNNAFGARLLDAQARRALFAALPPPALLATFDWLFASVNIRAEDISMRRFNRASLQANAGERDAARAEFQAVQAALRAKRQPGRLLDETERALAALGQP